MYNVSLLGSFKFRNVRCDLSVVGMLSFRLVVFVVHMKTPLHKALGNTHCGKNRQLIPKFKTDTPTAPRER